MSATDTTNPPVTAVIDGVNLHLISDRLLTIPNRSELRFLPRSNDGKAKVTELTGMTATAIDQLFRDLPEQFHEDGQKAAVPGRARNLVKSAVEDGWIVIVSVRFREVTVEFFAPVSTMQAVLRQTLATAVDRPQATAWEHTISRHTVGGFVSYGYDYEAGAMRVDRIDDERLLIGSEAKPEHGDAYRAVNLVDHRSSRHEEKLTWGEFVETIHANIPPLVEREIAAEIQLRADLANADVAFEAERNTVGRENLRQQLSAIVRHAEQRVVTLDAVRMPDLSELDDQRTVDLLVERAAERQAEQYLVDYATGLLVAEGRRNNDGRRLHLDEVVASGVRSLATAAINVVDPAIVTAQRVAQRRLNEAHTLAKLLPLVRLSISVDVVVD